MNVPFKDNCERLSYWSRRGHNLDVKGGHFRHLEPISNNRTGYLVICLPICRLILYSVRYNVIPALRVDDGGKHDGATCTLYL